MFHILHAFSDLSACESIDSERVFVVLRLCCILVSCVDNGLEVLSSTRGMLGIMSTVAQQCTHIPFQTCMWRSRGVTVLQAAVHIQLNHQAIGTRLMMQWLRFSQWTETEVYREAGYQC